MAKKLLIVIMLMSFVSAITPTPSFAQVPEEQSELSGTRKQLATIIFAGLAGAILGLSTLSFHGRPQEKLNNIAVGAALGIFGGVAFTTYKAARAPYEQYQGVQNNFEFENEFEKRDQSIAYIQPAVKAGWTWTF